MFSRYKAWLRAWRDTHERMFRKDAAYSSIPQPENIGFFRLANGGGVMSDACAQAQKMGREMEAKIRESYAQHLGAESWAALDGDAQLSAVRVHLAFCQNHLRNTGARRAVKFEDAYLQEIFDACLKGMDRRLRVTGKLSELLRAVPKEFLYTGSRLYKKGHGVDFLGWCLDKYPDSVVFVLERADLGTRNDIDFEAAVAIFMNHSLYMKYLKFVIDIPGIDNILEKNLFITLGSLEVLAAIRARAIFFLKVIAPMRFFANSADLEYSPVDMSGPMQVLGAFLENAKSDGSLLMDKDLDIFGESLNAEDLEVYASWKLANQNMKGRRANGTGRVNMFNLMIGYLYEPSPELDEAMTPATIEVIEQHCAGYFEAMGDTPMVDNLIGGKYSPERASAETKRDLAHMTSVSDLAESHHGAHKREQSTFVGAKSAEISAQATARMNHTFDPKYVALPQAANGKCPRACLTRYPLNAQKSLVAAARGLKRTVAAEDKQFRHSFLLAKGEAMRAKRDGALRRAASRLALSAACRAVAEWAPGTVEEELSKLPTESAQIKALKDQVNLFTKGYGWRECHTPFSSKSNKDIGKVPHLTDHLSAMLQGAVGRQRPPEDEGPERYHCKAGSLAVLGTLTRQAKEAREAIPWSAEELQKMRVDIAAEKARAAEEKAKAMHDAFALQQPEEPPNVDASLVGVRIEVMTRIEEPDDDGVMFYYNQWLPAVVIKLSDGSDKKVGKGRSMIPLGWTLLDYDDGFTEWAKLTSENFNCSRVGSWRLDLDAEPVDADGSSDSDSPGSDGDMQGEGEVEDEAESESEEGDGPGSDGEIDSDEEYGP